ncbi:MAG: hypothetical protein IH946_08995 [Bacteroidetes bacterium]|nr:hypothetical protein [Bacteroidota bacterium]
MKRIIYTILSLLFIYNVSVAQDKKTNNSVEQNYGTSSMASITVSSDETCDIYINGTKRGMVMKNIGQKYYIMKGNYTLKAVSGDKVFETKGSASPDEVNNVHIIFHDEEGEKAKEETETETKDEPKE